MLRNKPRTLRPSSISTKECIAPIPVLWYWILKEPRTVHVYKIAVDQNQKSSLFRYSIECYYIVQNTKSVAPLSTLESYGYGVYSYACIYQLSVEDFVTENPRWLLSLLCKRFSKILESNVVPVVCSCNYQFFSFFFPVHPLWPTWSNNSNIIQKCLEYNKYVYCEHWSRTVW